MTLSDGAASRSARRSRPGADAIVPASRRGRQPGAPERLADIDVAEPGDQFLVEERGLERRAAAAQESGQHRAVERVAGRLDAEPGEKGMGVKVGRLGEQHEAEAARVVEDDAVRPAVAVPR